MQVRPLRPLRVRPASSSNASTRLPQISFEISNMNFFKLVYHLTMRANQVTMKRWTQRNRNGNINYTTYVRQWLL